MAATICVYGSSSTRTKQSYLGASFELGSVIAKRGHVCINGGGKFGCMGSLNEGCRSENGSVVGVIHQMFVLDGGNDDNISDMLVSTGDDLSERKRLLLDNADAVIVLPGGVGTFDELWETISAKSLEFRGLASVPICVLNTDGYYDGFITQLKRAEEDGLLYAGFESYMHVATSPSDAVDWVELELKRHNWTSTRLDRKKLQNKS